MACKTVMDSAASMALLQQTSDVQDLVTEYSKELPSKENTVVDMDKAAAQAHETVTEKAREPVAKRSTYDIDELAAQNQMTDREWEAVRIKSEKEKRDKLERMEQMLLADYHDETDYNCLCSSAGRENEIVVMDDFQTGKWA